MSFQLLEHQIKALTQVAGSMCGSASSFHAGMVAAQLGSPLLAGQLMFVDALRLLAIIDMLPDMQDYEFDILVGAQQSLAFRELERMMGHMKKTAQELDMIERIINSLEKSVAEMDMMLGQLGVATMQLQNISQRFDKQSTTINQTTDRLQKDILPQLYKFRDTLMTLLERYRQEAKMRGYFLFINSRSYKAFLPQAHKMKLRRQGETSESQLLLKQAHLITGFAKWNKMLALLNKYIERNGRNVDDFIQAATIPLNRNKYSYVRKILDDGMKEHPEAIEIPRLLADVFAKRDMPEEEDALWEAWIANHPKPDKARKQIAKIKAERDAA